MGYDNCDFDVCHRLDDNDNDNVSVDDRDDDDETTTDRNSINQLSLWLWEMHNDVNVRLLREKNERKGLPEPTWEEEQAVRWPSARSCPLCWLNDSGRWDEKEVDLYLKMHYWPSMRNSEFETRLKRSMKEHIPKVDPLIAPKVIPFMFLFFLVLWF